MLVFGAYAVGNGVFTIVAAVANRRAEPRWVSPMVSGVLSVALGVLRVVMPGVTGILERDTRRHPVDRYVRRS
jgi:uncharacterized membrane protein HdeD (DUF308 family)